MKTKDEMAKNLCKFIRYHNEEKGEEWYYFYKGYQVAMEHFGYSVELIDNVLYIDEKSYKVEG